MRLAAFLLVLSLATTAPASPPATPHTGDAWVDARLIDIGRYAATYRDAFADELVRYQRAPRELVADLLARPGWTAGDAYFACALAVQLARPCRQIADARDAAPADDWATVAQRLGLAPPGWQAIRAGLVASYARWGRPLPAQSAPDAPPRDAPTPHPAPKTH